MDGLLSPKPQKPQKPLKAGALPKSASRRTAEVLAAEAAEAAEAAAPAEPITVAQVLAAIEHVRASPGLVRVRALSAGPDPAPPADGAVDFIVGQTVTTSTKCPVFLFGKKHGGLVLKGPMKLEVAALVEQRCRFFARESWRPEVHLQWQRVVDARGAHWLYCANVDGELRLPGLVQWARVYCYVPHAFACGFYDADVADAAGDVGADVAGAGAAGAGAAGAGAASGGAEKEMVAVWAWRAVRGSLPADSSALRVKDAFDVGHFPSEAIMARLFVHLALRFILGCGDCGFHNCLMAGVGIDFEDYRDAGAGAKASGVLQLMAPRGKLGKAQDAAFVAGQLSKCLPEVLAVVEGMDITGLEGVASAFSRRELMLSYLRAGLL